MPFRSDVHVTRTTDSLGATTSVNLTSYDNAAAPAAVAMKLNSGTSISSTGQLSSTVNSFLRGTNTKAQGAPAAKTVTAALSAADVVGGLITTTGVTAPSVHQLPTGALLAAAVSGIAVGDSLDFHIINTGTGASDDATITVNTGVTIVGNPTVGSLTDATIISGSGHFRARYTAADTFVVYRLA